MSKPAETAKAPEPSSSVRRRSSKKKPSADEPPSSVHRSSVLAAGLTGGGSMSAGSVLVKWASTRASHLASYDVKSKKEAPATAPDEQVAAAATQTSEAPKKVSFMALFSFATTKEKWLMLAGLLSAVVAGLGMYILYYEKILCLSSIPTLTYYLFCLSSLRWA